MGGIRATVKQERHKSRKFLFVLTNVLFFFFAFIIHGSYSPPAPLQIVCLFHTLLWPAQEAIFDVCK